MDSGSRRRSLSTDNKGELMSTQVIDLFNEEHMHNPYPRYEEMRNQCPVAHSSEHGGFWAVSRYADVKAVAQDFRTYSSAETNALVRHDLPKMIPIDMDPPDQRHYRKVVSPRLAKERVGVIEPVATEHARNLLGAFASAGECDFVAQFAQPFPMVPIFSIIGIGQEDVMRILGAADDAVRYRASSPSRAQAGAHAMLEFATNIAAEARVNPLPDTLIGDLVSGVVKGEPLTNEEIARFILILLFGALDTTTNTLAFIANFLSDKPELRASLRSDPDLLHRSIEEFVRLASTVQGLTRLCTRESKIGDQDIHEGERVLMLFGAANRDPEVFEDPHEFNADRNPHLHMGFGAGAHTCLGQHLARVLLEVGLREFLAVVPDYEVTIDQLTLKCSEVRGFVSLPLKF